MSVYTDTDSSAYNRRENKASNRWGKFNLGLVDRN